MNSKSACVWYPNQKPQKIFRLLKKHLRARNPDIEVINDGALEPFGGISEGPYAEALQDAVEQGFGRRPVFVREGGSIGAVATLQRAWKVPILFMGLSLPEHGYHAPNEYFDWGQASGGMHAFVEYFPRLKSNVTHYSLKSRKESIGGQTRFNIFIFTIV